MEKRNKGSIEVITGSMFSGKTEELIRRIKRAKFANQQVKIYKPLIDNRYGLDNTTSHNGIQMDATPVDDSSKILHHHRSYEVIAIDEVQFFDDGIIDVVRKIANSGTRVIVCGLDMDFEGNPFGPMSNLMSIADEVQKLHAICVDCGNVANFSYRKVSNEETVMLGELDEYKPLCRTCYTKNTKS
jgi:thymidine kinase